MLERQYHPCTVMATKRRMRSQPVLDRGRKGLNVKYTMIAAFQLDDWNGTIEVSEHCFRLECDEQPSDITPSRRPRWIPPPSSLLFLFLFCSAAAGSVVGAGID
jgi:hypothetical protein